MEATLYKDGQKVKCVKPNSLLHGKEGVVIQSEEVNGVGLHEVKFSHDLKVMAHWELEPV